MAKLSMIERGLLVLLAGGRSSRFGAPKARLRIGGEAILDWQRRRLSAALGEALGAEQCPRQGQTPRTPVQAWLSLPPASAEGHPADPPGATGYDRIVRDRQAFVGPIAGFIAAMTAASDDDVMLLATVDMPVIGAHEVRRLVETMSVRPDVTTMDAASQQSDAARHRPVPAGVSDAACIGVMSRWADGPDAGVIEPFPSLWRVRLARPALLSLVAAQGETLGPKALASLAGVRCMALQHDRDRAAWANINRPQDAAQAQAALGASITSEA